MICNLETSSLCAFVAVNYKNSVKIKKFYITIILFFVVNVISSQTRDEQILKGIEYVYHIKFDSANTIFQSFVNKDPNDPTGYFMLAMSKWWQIYINKEDNTYDDDYYSKVDKCIEICDKKLDKNENDDWAIFLKGGVIGYRGFLNSIRDNWLKAVDDGKQGLSLLQRSYEINPNNKDAIFGVGLYNYAAEYVGDKFPFLKALLFLFPKGNRELGLAQIKDCSENAKYSRTEAKFVLCFVNLNYERNYVESEKYADMLTKMYPENPVAMRFLGKSYICESKWNEGSVLWKYILSRNDSNVIGFNNKNIRLEALYYIGLSSQNLFQFDDGINYYTQSLNLSKELDRDKQSAYQVFSALGLGIIYDHKGNHNEAVKYYNMVLDMNDIENSHESAQKFKENGLK